jgi:hypothetical protein
MSNLSRRIQKVPDAKEKTATEVEAQASEVNWSPDIIYGLDKIDAELLAEFVNKLRNDGIIRNDAVIIQKHKERLAYNAAYQRDLRTIKRLGLAVTVKQYRESLKCSQDG